MVGKTSLILISSFANQLGGQQATESIPLNGTLQGFFFDHNGHAGNPREDLDHFIHTAPSTPHPSTARGAPDEADLHISHPMLVAGRTASHHSDPAETEALCRCNGHRIWGNGQLMRDHVCHNTTPRQIDPWDVTPAYHQPRDQDPYMVAPNAQAAVGPKTPFAAALASGYGFPTGAVWPAYFAREDPQAHSFEQSYYESSPKRGKKKRSPAKGRSSNQGSCHKYFDDRGGEW